LPCLASNHSLQGSFVKQKRVKTSPIVQSTTPLVQPESPLDQPTTRTFKETEVIDLCTSSEEEAENDVKSLLLVSYTEDENDVGAFVPHEARSVTAEWGVDTLERAADNIHDLSDNDSAETSDDNEVCCKCI
jgi:hypothetical protein